MKTFAIKERRKAHASRRVRAPSIHPAGPTLRAQRAEIRQILRTPQVQPKLTIGQPGDRYEQEADRVANQVMRMPEPHIQRVCTECEEELDGQKLHRQTLEPEEEEEKNLQSMELRRQPEAGEKEEEEEEILSAKAQPGHTPEVTPNLETHINALRGGGQPLPDSTRAFFEPRFVHDFSRVRVHTDRKAAKVPSGPSNEFEDCPIDWQRKAEAALVIGRRWVGKVITGLAKLPDPIPTPIAFLLNQHFHTINRDQIAKIIQHYKTIDSAINRSIDFECETSCDDNVAAYVYLVWTDLHLCPIWYGLPSRGQANTIMHELAHDAAGRDDKAYVWQPGYRTLSPEDAIDNADSYSNFADDASVVI